MTAPASQSAARAFEPASSGDAVHGEVAALLERAPAFGEMEGKKRSSLVDDMAKIAGFLASDPAWLQRSGSPPLARGLDALRERLSEAPKQAGSDFKAGAVAAGTREFGNLVQTVDFPAFVSGLVNGVFQAVVDASIQQMEAYAEMLSAVAKSADEFARDNIDEARARDHLRNRHPQLLDVDTSAPDRPARLVARPDADLASVAQKYGLSTLDLDDEASERALVDAARLEMARSRQQLLATMVLMGINRIVVTNGRINAKVVFDMKASDSAARKAKASMHETKSENAASGVAASGGLFGFGFSAYSNQSSSFTATVSSAVDDTSSSKAAMKAQLSGDVNLAFRSETFPLERMVDTAGLQMLNRRAQPLTSTGSASAPPGANTR